MLVSYKIYKLSDGFELIKNIMATSSNRVTFFIKLTGARIYCAIPMKRSPNLPFSLNPHHTIIL